MRDGYVVNSGQMGIVRLNFHLAGVEKTMIYAIKRHLEGLGLTTPSGKADWDTSFIRGILVNDLYKPHTFEEIRQVVS